MIKEPKILLVHSKPKQGEIKFDRKDIDMPTTTPMSAYFKPSFKLNFLNMFCREEGNNKNIR